MNANLYAHMRQRQQGRDDVPALLWEGKVFSTYGAWPAHVGRARAALVELGVGTGDRVMVKSGNSPAFILAYLATLSLGAVFVPLNPAYTAVETAALMEDAEPALFLHDQKTAVPAADMLSKVRRMTLNSDGTGEFPAFAMAMQPDVAVAERSADDLACLLFTSGTTGRPKGAMLTHGNLSSNVAALFALWQFQPDDRILHALPLFHAHGLFVALHLGLWSGATIDLLPRFEADAVFAHLPRASVFMGVPTFYTRLLEDQRLTRESVAHMRLFVSGSAPLLASSFEAFEARTGQRILERYGMTEAVMIASNPYEQDQRIAGTVGYPLPGVQARVVTDEGKALPAGEAGELEISGPNVCKGYWRRPEATAESFFADGFFRTGDTARMEADGRITIVGRSKDLIISGGFNVYPAEVEMVIAECAGVTEAAVFGVPHPDFGEAVVVAITTDRPIDEAALMAHAATSLARFKQPKKIIQLEALPRNTMGKVLKAELRKTYANLF